VVEADRSELERIGNLLEDWHYQVVRADDGKEAHRLVKKVRPALVVTALELPGLSGVELCQKIKREAKTADIPCLCVAFPEEIEDREIQTGLFTGEYVQKPVSARRFKRQVESVLSEWGQSQTEGPVLGDVSLGQIDRFLEEFEQEKITRQSRTGKKKVQKQKVPKKKIQKKKVQKKATQKAVPPKKATQKAVPPKKATQKAVPPKKATQKAAPPKKATQKAAPPKKAPPRKAAQKAVLPRATPPKTVKPVAPPAFAGIDDILEEFGLKSSRDALVASTESRPKAKRSELGLARVEQQKLNKQQKTSGKKVQQKQVQKKTVQKRQVEEEQVKPVAPPAFAGIDDILEEFGLKSSRDALVASTESRPKAKRSELGLARVEQQKLNKQQKTSGKKVPPKKAKKKTVRKGRILLMHLEEEQVKPVAPPAFAGCTSSAKVGRFGFQVKRQFEPMLIGLV
jgi:DNA-binding response OmpR family regulator